MSQQMLEELKKELKSSVTQHFKVLCENFPGERFYGYSLYSSDDVSAIGPVANRLGALKVDLNSPEYTYYRYCPDEWSDWDDYGLFDDVNKTIKSLYDVMVGDLDDESDEKFDCYSRGILAQALQALKELSDEGLFGAKTDDRFLILYLSDSADEIMTVSAKELNTSKVFNEFISFF